VSELAELTRLLVAVDSVNPGLAAGAAGEAEVVRLVAGWAERAGLEVEVEEVAPGRPNAIVVARGSGGGRSLMLNAHTDTVGVSGMDDPFSGRIDGDRLYGRGAHDMKGSLAACLLVAERASRLGLRGDVVVTAVCDEELESIGTEAVVARRTADAAIVTEPTDERLAVAHKGFAGFEIEVEGVAAHGSRPDVGVDAIVRMGQVLARLEALCRELEDRAPHPLLGTGSAHASVIEGGQEYSSYPASCRLVGERRSLPGETLDLIEGEVRALLGSLPGSARLGVSRGPFEIPPDDPFVELVAAAAGDPEIVGVPFWADSGLLAEAGIPTVLYGPCGEGLHGVVEWVDLASLERCAKVYLAVAEQVCA
jgi:acetylornithine deacetylase/succinyl-diaminopimelate desuccinylase-like protein